MNKLIYAGTITTGGDFNTAQTSGVYRYNGMPSNRPGTKENDYGIFYVMVTDSYVVQHAYSYLEQCWKHRATVINTYAWSDWKSEALKSDLSDFMQYMGTFSGDFNNLKIATGIYLIDALNSYSNGPKTWNPSYCIFIQYPGSHFHFQHLISTNKMATRRYAGAPPIWEPWNIFSGVAET